MCKCTRFKDYEVSDFGLLLSAQKFEEEDFKESKTLHKNLLFGAKLGNYIYSWLHRQLFYIKVKSYVCILLVDGRNWVNTSQLSRNKGTQNNDIKCQV